LGEGGACYGGPLPTTVKIPCQVAFPSGRVPFGSRPRPGFMSPPGLGNFPVGNVGRKKILPERSCAAPESGSAWAPKCWAIYMVAEAVLYMVAAGLRCRVVLCNVVHGRRGRLGLRPRPSFLCRSFLRTWQTGNAWNACFFSLHVRSFLRMGRGQVSLGENP